jgi:hypothetical protein
MVNTGITGASSDGYGTSGACLAVAGLPRCGGPACQLSKEN